MPKQDFRLAVIVRTLENETCLAEALFFPEVSRYGAKLLRASDGAAANARQALENEALSRLHTRVVPENYELREVSVTVEPPRRSELWRKPVELTFQVVRWRQGDAAHVAFVPALDIEVVAVKENELDELIPQHITAELMRSKATESLGSLLWQQRTQDIAVKELIVSPNIRTPKQIAAESEVVEEKSILKEVAADLTTARLPPVFEVADDVARVAEALTARRVRSVLLVGPSGVGKTSLVNELARRRKDFKLSDTPFWATSGAQLVAGQTGFGMWQERCQKVVGEAVKTKAIIHLGNLVELLEVGKYEGNEQGLASFFRPVLARGDFTAIAECTPEQISFVERAESHLLQVFQQIRLEEPTPERGREILRQFAASRTPRGGVCPLDEIGLAAVDRLHRRYATYSAYPGRPVRFLRNLLDDWRLVEISNSQSQISNAQSQISNAQSQIPEDKAQISERDVVSAFSQETGLPLFLLDDETPLDVNHIEAWLAARVIGQNEAVQLVTDLIATVKAGLTRPRKPIASLLFIGPTGVGKTEMAKSLAEFFFRDRNRLLRFDMSEYADPLAVKRLIGGVTATEGQLTAKMREQPFAVVLFDEVEKADASFFDLLLQLLGEGRLTDAGRRVADFCNAVVIMTSNLGAETYQRGIGGFVANQAGQREARQHFTKAVRQAVRPELFNRIDRIVPFAPLDPTTVLRIAERELNNLRQRDGLRYRAINLNVDNSLAQHLARVGYHPRYGARPLKRALERELLVPLAQELNQHSSETPLDAAVSLADEQLSWTVQPQPPPKNWREAAKRNSALGYADSSTELRRKMQRLEAGPTVQSLRNNVWRLQDLERRMRLKAKKKRQPFSPLAYAQLAQLPKLQHVLALVESTAQAVNGVEERALLNLYGNAHTPLSELSAEVSAIEKALSQAKDDVNALLYTLLALKYDEPHRVTVGVFCENRAFLYSLARAYHAHAVARGYAVKCFRYTTQMLLVGELSLSREPLALLGRTVTLQTFAAPGLALENEGAVGILLECAGSLAFPRFMSESGLHKRLEKDERPHRCFVMATNETAEQFAAPEFLAERGSVAESDARRNYDTGQGVLADKLLNKNFAFKGGDFSAALGLALDERLQKEAEALAL